MIICHVRLGLQTLLTVILDPETYADLHAFSVTRLNDFWLTVWEFTGVKASVHPYKVGIHGFG